MYEPQEDSIMLKEAIEQFLKKEPQEICADLGTGTGIQGLTMIPRCKKVLFIDINPEAINYVSHSLNKEQKQKAEFIESDLFKNVNPELKGRIGLIAFNPPYLPREQDEEEDEELTSGTKGINTTLRFIKESKPFLNKKGKLLFVVSSHSDVESINEELKKQNYKYKIIKKAHFFFEDIMIYEAYLDEDK